ncbi:MAG: hypothetical protein WDW36_000795 [Sanguina aurantia]
MQLKVAVNKEAYAEEARKAGAVQLLTRLLSRTEDEQVLEAAASIISACSGAQASGGKVVDYCYDGMMVQIKQGALGDGLGAKVWQVCHNLCREMTKYPEMVAGHRVLEIGAGCGVCGILAAKLGASEAVLSDHEEPVLGNLRTCMHLNDCTASTPSAAAAAPLQPPSAPTQQALVPNTTAHTTAPQGKAHTASLSAQADPHSHDTQSHDTQSHDTQSHDTQSHDTQSHHKASAEARACSDDADLFDDAESVDDLDMDSFLGAGDEESGCSKAAQNGADPARPTLELDMLPGARSCGFRVLDRTPLVVARAASALPDASTSAAATAVSGSQGPNDDGCGSCSSGGSGGGCRAASPGPLSLSWENGVCRVVYMDWMHSVDHLAAQQDQQDQQDQQETPAGGGHTVRPPPEQPAAEREQREGSSLPPSLPPSDRFPVILGTDILYEMPHAAMVAAVLAHRLEAGGKAVLGCAVRQHAIIARFQKECVLRGLRFRQRRVQLLRSYDGVAGRNRDYEGGFLLMAVDRLASPCQTWHSPDFEEAAVGFTQLQQQQSGPACINL